MAGKAVEVGVAATTNRSTDHGAIFVSGGAPRQIIGALAILTICGILAVGLWPFHSPTNRVRWSDSASGIRFSRHGTILSSGALDWPGSEGPSCSLEIWVQPASTWNTGTLLAFYHPSTARQFSLQQVYTDLVLQRDIRDQHRQPKLAEMYVGDVFRRKQIFVTVVSNGQDTAVYIDGHLATRSLGFGLSLADLTGKLILATSPLQNNSWPGELRGLAIYGTDLNAEQVARHFENWTQRGDPAIAGTERALALYLFGEHGGKVIHNQIGSAGDLYIPDRYLVVDQVLLEPPWQEFRTQRNYLKNIIINIAGFVPLGLFVYAYLAGVQQMKGAAVVTVLVGLTVSFAIEVLQAHLATRNSGVTDLITNTFGTCLGVVICRAAALPLGRALGARRYRRDALYRAGS